MPAAVNMIKINLCVACSVLSHFLVAFSDETDVSGFDFDECISSSKCPNNSTIGLDGAWFGYSLDKPWINFTARVPFTVHSQLIKVGVLQDPYYRFNDRDDRWVSLDTWAVTTKFNLGAAFLSQAKTSLVFESIDTIADVYLNGVRIGGSKNKFVPNIFDVTDLVLKGKNKVTVVLMSPIKYASLESLLYKNKFNYAVLPNCYPNVLHGECHSNFIRKEPLSFGWDFGPSFPTQGLFGSVYVQSVKTAFIENLLINVKMHIGQWAVNVCASINDHHFGKFPVSINFKVVELNLGVTTKKKIIFKGSGKVCIDFDEIPANAVQQWWPWQYGQQTLYTLKAGLLSDDNQEVHVKEAKFGFRTVELIQEPIAGSEGLSFYFKINGIEMFLKGSNWVPTDAFRDRVSNRTVESYLQAAVEANMNVLRVWGGGGYETDFFYETCDKKGILVWHDFMFACAMYPTNKEFVQLVENEVRHQVMRLQSHPSIIIWSGNNENEVALRENWYGTSVDFNLYKKDYIKLYVETVKPLVELIDPTRPFIVSSPSNALESESEGWVAQNPRSPLYGDVHYYNYTANCWDTTVFPKPRFASEYGYQSYPSYETLEKISLEDDLTWDSILMIYRQHHQDGNQQIENMISQNYMLPRSTDKRLYFKKMIYLSQIVQAVCITKETEHYRSLRGRLVREKSNTYHVQGKMSKESRDDTMVGHTMGAMYWQLNDVWQAPSWSSIEYGGKWKMLHYHARDFFRNVIVTYNLLRTTLRLFVVSDILEKVPAILSVTSFKWTSFNQLMQKRIKITIEPKVAVEILQMEVTDFCKQPRECFMILDLEVEHLPNYSYSRPVFLTPLNQAIGLTNPHIAIMPSDMQRVSANTICFKIRVTNPAAFLWLSSDVEGRFSDNGFLQYKNSKELNFTSVAPVDLKTFSGSLKALSYYDVTVG